MLSGYLDPKVFLRIERTISAFSKAVLETDLSSSNHSRNEYKSFAAVRSLSSLGSGELRSTFGKEPV